MQSGSKGYVSVGAPHVLAGRPYFVKVLGVSTAGVACVEVLGPRGKKALADAGLDFAFVPVAELNSDKDIARERVAEIKRAALTAKIVELEAKIDTLENEKSDLEDTLQELEYDSF